MQLKKLQSIIITTVLLLCEALPAQQQAEVVQSYIDTYSMIAVAEQKRTGVPAAIKLAQAIHESGGGTGALCKKSNNHFGIKCKSWWKGATAYHDDDTKGECFRAYPTVEDSYRDHSDFLKTGPHYAFLFKLPPTDYKAWALGLKQAGYATNDKYPQALIKIIETYNLGAYTIFALTDTLGGKGAELSSEK